MAYTHLQWNPTLPACHDPLQQVTVIGVCATHKHFRGPFERPIF